MREPSGDQSNSTTSASFDISCEILVSVLPSLFSSARYATRVPSGDTLNSSPAPARLMTPVSAVISDPSSNEEKSSTGSLIFVPPMLAEKTAGGNTAEIPSTGTTKSPIPLRTPSLPSPPPESPLSSLTGSPPNKSKLKLPHLQPKIVVKLIKIKIIAISRDTDFLSGFINLLMSY